MKPNKNFVAIRLKEIKKKSDLTIDMFALKVDSTKTKMNSYMRGVSLPPEDTVQKIANVFNVDKKWLYFGEPEEFIDEYLKFEGLDEILNYYPDFNESIKKKYVRLKANNKYDEELLRNVIEDKILDLIENQVNDFLKENHTEFYIYDKSNIDDGLYQDIWFDLSEEFFGLINNELKYTWFKNDEDFILIVLEHCKSIKNFIKTRNPLYLQQFKFLSSSSDNLLDYLSEELKTEYGVSNLVKNLSTMWGLNFEFGTEESMKVLDAFKELGLKLDNIARNKS